MKQQYLQKGIVALLRHDLPTAYRVFAALYHSKQWQTRDAALTGLSDLLDTRLYAEGKKPSICIAIGWEPPKHLPPIKNVVPKNRLLVLLDHYWQRSRIMPQTIAEKKALDAMRDSLALIENALIYDPSYLIRYSAYVILAYFMIENPRFLLLPTLEKALKQEKNLALRGALQELLRDSKR